MWHRLSFMLITRHSRILLQLTVKSRTPDLPVRLLDFTLQLPEGLQLQSAALPPLNAVIFPQQSANFVYELALGVAGDADDVPVSFALSYRTLDHGRSASARQQPSDG